MKNGFSADCNLGDMVKKYLDDLKKQIDGVESIDAGILKDNATDKDGIKVKDVAIYNEFGTEDIPARSFLRSTLKENKQAYFKQLIKLIQRRNTIKQAAALIGEQMRADIDKKIRGNLPPPNKENTIRAWSYYNNNSEDKKQRERQAKKLRKNKRTLIWSGRMANSVDFRINEKKG